MKKWIILTSTLCQGTIPAYFDEGDDDDGSPVIWDTKEEAYEELVLERIDTLQRQLAEAKAGDRDWESVDVTGEDWVEECEVKEDGSILIESGEIYNPKTYVR